MKEELLDRFGEIPKYVDNLLRVALIRMQAHRLYITEVKGKNEVLKLTMKQDAKIKVEGIGELVENSVTGLCFNAKGTPCLETRYKKGGMVERDEENLLLLTENVLEEMERYLL